MSRPDQVIVGKVRAAYGLRGEVWVTSLSDVPGRYETLEHVTARMPGGDERSLRIAGCRESPKGLRVAFDGIDDRDAADELSGSVLVVQADEVPDLPEGTFYVFDLVDLSAVTEDGSRLGKVRDVLGNAANDVLVIDTQEGGELLLPATREVIRRVDLEGREVTVHVLPGLAE